jgi:ubiquinone/menaquinone biosynthesis C-methylase UbiE
MSGMVCPWWLGYFLVNPLRRLYQNPSRILGPYVKEGMTVLEPGCGMGFFSIEIARRVGPRGKLVAVDLQPKMLAGLKRRAARAGLSERIDARQAQQRGVGLEDLEGEVDLALAFWMVHEVADAPRFLAEIHRALKPGGKLFIIEPMIHVSKRGFSGTLEACRNCGFKETARPRVGSNWTALLMK